MEDLTMIVLAQGPDKKDNAWEREVRADFVRTIAISLTVHIRLVGSAQEKDAHVGVTNISEPSIIAYHIMH